MKTPNNMYKLAVKRWNPFAGCRFDCRYCRPSFQAQAKRQRKRCQQCYRYEPHEHPKRLTDSLARTGFMQFIFTCASGDVAFCSTGFLERIVERMRQEKDKTFLLQSKDPTTFERVKFPPNVILGTTIETNRDDLCASVSVARPASERCRSLRDLDHPLKMVTIEPVMDFDLDVMVGWIREIKPAMVWIGYDSRRSGLVEPPLEKVKALHWELSLLKIPVVLKTIREGRVGSPTKGK